MSDSPASTPDDLLAEAERRAADLRAGGQLPADIDDRLADDYLRASRRDIERAPLTTAEMIESLRSAPSIDMSRVEVVAARPGGATAKRLANRLLRDQLIGLASQTEQARTATIDALDAMLSEIDRLRRLADNAVATADMLAARVTCLERELASLPRPTESPDDHSH